MIKKLCNACGRFCWHNATTTKYSGWRCTFCGTPVATGLKREAAEALMRKQVAKPLKEQTA